jgi:hypothetical protein
MVYFDQLTHDLGALIDTSESYDMVVNNIEFDHSQVAYVELLKAAMKEFNTLEKDRSNTTSLETKIGSTLLTVLTHHASLDIETACCEESEARLALSLDQQAIANPNLRSPVILTHSGEPVAALKQTGMRSIYGIEDIPELGIYRGMFHATTHTSSKPLPIPGKSEHAWHTPLDTPLIDITGPTRPSLFLIPESVRHDMPIHQARSEWGELDDWIATGAHYSHDDIATLIHAAMEHAVSIDT